MRLKVVTVHLSSLDRNFTVEIECLVVNQPPARHPQVKFNRRDFPYLDRLTLADNKAGEDSPIDIIIGANALRHVLRSDPIVHPPVRGPSAVSTEFGWVLMGHTAEEVIRQFEVVSANAIDVKDTGYSRCPEPGQPGHGSDLRAPGIDLILELTLIDKWICFGCKQDEDSLRGANLMKCSRCLLVHYCSAKCQKTDFESHKVSCKLIRKQRDCLAKADLALKNLETDDFYVHNVFVEVVAKKQSTLAGTIFKLGKETRLKYVLNEAVHHLTELARFWFHHYDHDQLTLLTRYLLSLLHVGKDD